MQARAYRCSSCTSGEEWGWVSPHSCAADSGLDLWASGPAGRRCCRPDSDTAEQVLGQRRPLGGGAAQPHREAGPQPRRGCPGPGPHCLTLAVHLPPCPPEAPSSTCRPVSRRHRVTPRCASPEGLQRTSASGLGTAGERTRGLVPSGLGKDSSLPRPA